MLRRRKSTASTSPATSGTDVCLFNALYLGRCYASETSVSQEGVEAALGTLLQANTVGDMLVSIRADVNGILVTTRESPEVLLEVSLSAISLVTTVRDKKALKGLKGKIKNWSAPIFAFVHRRGTRGFACELFSATAAADLHDRVRQIFFLFDSSRATRPPAPCNPFVAIDAHREPIHGPLYRRQIHRADLVAVREIGQGQFGQVYLAEHFVTPGTGGGGSDSWMRAVKLLHSTAASSDKAEFLREAETMLQFDHPNLVNLVGVAVQQRPWLAVLEFMRFGDLHAVVKKCQQFNVILHSLEHLCILSQIARGMEYLAGIGFVHMDLAARNCLLAEANIVKIGDFGLTRKIPAGQTCYELRQTLRLPIKWLALECLNDKIFSQKSDVWAWAVLCWEILSYGANPYEDLPSREVPNLIRQGVRLDPAPGSMGQLYELQLQCWLPEPAQRPTFSTIKQTLLRLAVSLARGPPLRDIGLTLESSKEGRPRDILLRPESNLWSIDLQPISSLREPKLGTEPADNNPFLPASPISTASCNPFLRPSTGLPRVDVKAIPRTVVDDKDALDNNPFFRPTKRVLEQLDSTNLDDAEVEEPMARPRTGTISAQPSEGSAMAAIPSLETGKSGSSATDNSPGHRMQSLADHTAGNPFFAAATVASTVSAFDSDLALAIQQSKEQFRLDAIQQQHVAMAQVSQSPFADRGITTQAYLSSTSVSRSSSSCSVASSASSGATYRTKGHVSKPEDDAAQPDTDSLTPGYRPVPIALTLIEAERLNDHATLSACTLKEAVGRTNAPLMPLSGPSVQTNERYWAVSQLETGTDTAPQSSTPADLTKGGNLPSDTPTLPGTETIGLIDSNRLPMPNNATDRRSTSLAISNGGLSLLCDNVSKTRHQPTQGDGKKLAEAEQQSSAGPIRAAASAPGGESAVSRSFIALHPQNKDDAVTHNGLHLAAAQSAPSVSTLPSYTIAHSLDVQARQVKKATSAKDAALGPLSPLKDSARNAVLHLLPTIATQLEASSTDATKGRRPFRSAPAPPAGALPLRQKRLLPKPPLRKKHLEGGVPPTSRASTVSTAPTNCAAAFDDLSIPPSGPPPPPPSDSEGSDKEL